MKVSLNWLKELVELPADTNALADLLTKAGVEVEGIEKHGIDIENVVIAQIREFSQHPDADRLSVCQVDDGSGEPRQIVCGAKNFKAGDKVPLALPGAVLPGDFKIKVGKLRGVKSEGMMCSGKELGVDEDAAGLLILSENAPVGAPIASLFPGDTILDLEVTPNRPDLLSHIGMAREIATLLDKPLRLPAGVTSELPGTVACDQITLSAPAACPFYSVQLIKGVKVGPSPDWLVSKLEAAGVRAINNVVDITNYVMLELGQPLHAFDIAKLNGGLNIRTAAAGEKLLALDGKEYELAAHHLVIADSATPVALAGIMGGEHSGVTEGTTDILLESAYFTPSGIRKASRELGLSSDSSYRFERGVDPAGVLRASARAAALIVEIAGGSIEPGIDTAGSAPEFSPVVPFRLERANEVLGANVSDAQATQILSGFGLEKAEGGWKAPSFRQDLTREIDLIEEIARVIGIEAVPARVLVRPAGASEADRRHDQAMGLRRALVALGYREARSLTLISEKEAALFPAENLLRVRNPLNEDQVVLRPSLLPGLLEAVAHNIRNGNRTLRLFEVGRIFREDKRREERAALALVLTGEAAPASWRNTKPAAADFFDLKGAIAALPFISCKGSDFTFAPASHPALALAVEIRLHNRVVGLAGQLFPARARELDVATPLLVAELNLDLISPAPGRKKFRDLPKFPAVTRDIALLAPLDLAHEAIEARFKDVKEPLLVGIELFDTFADPSGEKIPADKKSLAYALTYRSSERTLTAEEVTEAHTRLKEHLKAGLPVIFRE